MNQLHEHSKLRTIVLSDINYQKLKQMGSMEESFNDVLSKLPKEETK
jgi:predicted CopG family antitoxin